MSGNQSALIGAGGGIKPTGLINGASVLQATVSAATYPLDKIAGSSKKTLSGSVVAATLKTALLVSGRGVLAFAACANVDTTSRTHRLKITIDGVVIFDATSAATIDQQYSVFCSVGSITSTTSGAALIPEYLSFDASLLIEYASSLTETDKSVISFRYIPR